MPFLPRSVPNDKMAAKGLRRQGSMIRLATTPQTVNHPRWMAVGRAEATPEEVHTMSKPSTSDFLAAANAAYSGDPAATSGLSVLTGRNGAPVEVTRPKDGFHGVALETGSGQVIIAFEGTALGSLSTRPTFVEAQLVGDEAIAKGQDPAAYADALRFANRAMAVAEAQGIDSSNIFVAGHSSGGAEAEYVAVKTGLGGETFGAPGIPAADINTGLPSHLTNFVDYGDPVGNYSANPNRVGNLLMGDDIVRYGRPTYVGQASDSASLAAAGRLYGSSDLGTAAAASLVIQGVVNHHLIGDYAADLGVTLPGGNGGAGSNLTAADIKGALAPFLDSAGTGGGNIGSLLGGLGLDAPAEAHAGGGLMGSHGVHLG